MSPPMHAGWRPRACAENSRIWSFILLPLPNDPFSLFLLSFFILLRNIFILGIATWNGLLPYQLRRLSIRN